MALILFNPRCSMSTQTLTKYFGAIPGTQIWTPSVALRYCHRDCWSELVRACQCTFVSCTASYSDALLQLSGLAHAGSPGSTAPPKSLESIRYERPHGRVPGGAAASRSQPSVRCYLLFLLPFFPSHCSEAWWRHHTSVCVQARQRSHAVCRCMHTRGSRIAVDISLRSRQACMSQSHRRCDLPGSGRPDCPWNLLRFASTALPTSQHLHDLEVLQSCRNPLSSGHLLGCPSPQNTEQDALGTAAASVSQSGRQAVVGARACGVGSRRELTLGGCTRLQDHDLGVVEELAALTALDLSHNAYFTDAGAPRSRSAPAATANFLQRSTAPAHALLCAAGEVGCLAGWRVRNCRRLCLYLWALACCIPKHRHPRTDPLVRQGVGALQASSGWRGSPRSHRCSWRGAARCGGRR